MRQILAVGLTNSQESNVYQNCSLVNFILDWDRSVIDLTVPGEKTKSLWSSQTSQSVRKFRYQIQSIEGMGSYHISRFCVSLIFTHRFVLSLSLSVSLTFSLARSLFLCRAHALPPSFPPLAGLGSWTYWRVSSPYFRRTSRFGDDCHVRTWGYC